MSVQKPLIHLIDSRIDRSAGEVIGTCVSPTYRWFDQDVQSYIWVMDIDLSRDGSRPDAGNIAKAVPIADASHGVHKSGPGTKVRLWRSSLTRSYEIIGLAAIVSGQVSVSEVTYGASSIVIGSPTTFGSSYRLLNFSELGDSANNGGYSYGTLPYGTMGKYDANGNLLTVLVVP